MAAHPHLGRIDEVAENAWQPLPVKAPAKASFRNAIKDFYLTNPVARASAVKPMEARSAACQSAHALHSAA